MFFPFPNPFTTHRTTVEINIAIIAACFPCLKPIFKTLLDGTSAAARYGSSKYKGYVRNADSNRTPGSGVRTAPRSATAPEFEMYNQATGKFTTDVKTGNSRLSMTGSEESILPQDMKTPPGATVAKADGITKTSTVFVTYDKRRRSEGWESEA
jgi:hypothetical protein